MDNPEIRLVQTCFACPEQYDAFLDNKMVGYVRLRFGCFTVNFPNVNGEVIYSHEFEDEYKGIFDSEERDFYLNEAKKAILLQLEVTA